MRAVPGGLTPAPKGGYESSLEFDLVKDTFLATYNFVNESDATIAANAGLGERAMAWELTDPDGNRQGMTIAENGEPGGPGMGGCPNGPLQSGPPGPSNSVAVDVKDGIQVNWTPVVAIPGTPAITGYRVTAIADSSINNEQVEIGKRITNPGATSTLLTGIASADYDVYVVSLSDVGETFPAVKVPETAPDRTAPTVSASPAGGSYPVAQQVTLTANEFGSDIYYTLDGTDPIIGDQLSTPEPLHYTGPITIDSPELTTLKFTAFDPSNNPSTIGEAHYYITNDPLPTKTAFTTSTVGVGSVTLNWAPADAGVPGKNIVDYQVNVFDTIGGSAVKTVNTNGVTSALIEGLNGDTQYWFTVQHEERCHLGLGSRFGCDRVDDARCSDLPNVGVDQSGVVRGTTVTLSGAGSSGGTTYTWTQLVTDASRPDSDGRRCRQGGADAVRQGRRLHAAVLQVRDDPKALTFELTVTPAEGDSRTDVVVITPRSDTVTVGTGKWKQNDFRISGTGSTNGAIVTVRSADGKTVYGNRRGHRRRLGSPPP